MKDILKKGMYIEELGTKGGHVFYNQLLEDLYSCPKGFIVLRPTPPEGFSKPINTSVIVVSEDAIEYFIHAKKKDKTTKEKR